MSQHLPAGTATGDGYVLDVSPERAGWTYSGLRVVELAVDERVDLDTGEAETLVVPLAGSCVVECDGERVELAGRDSVFAGPTDLGYLPRDAHARLTSSGGGSFALPSAVCERRLPVAYVPAADVPVELRGAGRASREVHDLGTPGVLDADRLICCEVLTPAGNWSSWPPHKHDEDRAGESVLEEIYYFQVAEPGGVAYQRAYTRPETHPHRELDVLVEVRSGDVVLVPYGWHGPSMAAPGYDLYYLNVMAGPGERAWRICDDPAHAWVRGQWEREDVDPRLPFTAERDVSTRSRSSNLSKRHSQRGRGEGPA